MELRDGYKRTEVGLVPATWTTSPLRDLVDQNRRITYGIVVPGPAFRNGIPMIRAQDYSNGWVDLDDLYRVSPQIDKSYKRSKVIAGDVLLTIVGSVGNIAKVPTTFNGSNITQQTARLSFDPGIANADYFFNILQSNVGKKALSNYTKSGVQPSLNLSDVEKFVLPVPSLPEQLAIATALSNVDALLAKIDQLIAKKRDLKQAAMQQLLTGQTRLPGFSGEWEVKRLGDLAETGSGGTPPSSVAAYYDGDIPWVSIADMTSGGKVIFATERNLTAEGLKNSAAQMYPEGTVLYAMYASIGECSLAGVPLCSSQAILGIRTKAMLDKDFLFYHLTSLKPIIKTMGQQGTQANLNAGMVRAFEIKLPKLAEQVAIATVLSDMDAELAALEARRAKTRALKQGVMQALLTGRIRLVGVN